MSSTSMILQVSSKDRNRANHYSHCSKELSREERVLKKQKLGGPSNSNKSQHALFRKRQQEIETAKKRAM